MRRQKLWGGPLCGYEADTDAYADFIEANGYAGVMIEVSHVLPKADPGMANYYPDNGVWRFKAMADDFTGPVHPRDAESF